MQQGRVICQCWRKSNSDLVLKHDGSSITFPKKSLISIPSLIHPGQIMDSNGYSIYAEMLTADWWCIMRASSCGLSEIVTWHNVEYIWVSWSIRVSVAEHVRRRISERSCHRDSVRALQTEHVRACLREHVTESVSVLLSERASQSVSEWALQREHVRECTTEHIRVPLPERQCQRPYQRAGQRACQRSCQRACQRASQRACQRAFQRVCQRVCQRACQRVCQSLSESVRGKLWEIGCDSMILLEWVACQECQHQCAQDISRY